MGFQMLISETSCTEAFSTWDLSYIHYIHRCKGKMTMLSSVFNSDFAICFLIWLLARKKQQVSTATATPRRQTTFSKCRAKLSWRWSALDRGPCAASTSACQPCRMHRRKKPKNPWSLVARQCGKSCYERVKGVRDFWILTNVTVFFFQSCFNEETLQKVMLSLRLAPRSDKIHLRDGHGDVGRESFDV